jgi:hypothetical protein
MNEKLKKEDIIYGIKILTSSGYEYRGTDISVMIDVWFTIFKDCTREMFINAIAMFMANDTKNFFPAPGQIRQYIVLTNTKRKRKYTDIWAEIRKAISNSTYYSIEQFELLSCEAKEIVRDHSNLRRWAMDEDFNESVIYSNLQKIYNDNQRREEEIAAIPENLRIGIGFEEDEIKKIPCFHDDLEVHERKVSDLSLVNNMIYDLKRKMCN